MSTIKSDRVESALRPVRAELLRRAAADADRVLADARSAAERVVANAQINARAVTEKARAAGEAAGVRAAAADAAALRRELRREVLTAQDDAYRQWRRRGSEAVLRLRDDPGYAGWQDALRQIAGAALGEGAQVTEAPEGGVVAERGRRRLDLSLTAIAARALDQIAPTVDGLWS